MTTLIWIAVVAVCLLGGVLLGRYTAPGVERARAIERERDEARAELRRYRDDVRSHFEKTAQLFNAVSSDYRALHEHLARDSERLGEPSVSRLLDNQPEAGTLEGPESGQAAAAESEHAGGATPAADANDDAARGRPHAGPSADNGVAAADEPAAESETASGDQPADTTTDDGQSRGNAAETPAR